MSTSFIMRYRRTRDGSKTLAIEDNRGRVYAGLAPHQTSWASRLLEIVQTAHQAGQDNREPKGLTILKSEGRYVIAGMSTGTAYAGISTGLLGANRGEARRLFQIVEFAYQRGQGIETPTLSKPPKPVKVPRINHRPILRP